MLSGFYCKLKKNRTIYVNNSKTDTVEKRLVLCL